MDRQGLSVRGLARRMDPVNLDRARRNLHRWLDEGITPNRGSREEIATALGVSESDLPDDDEEAEIVADLLAALRRIVRDEFAKEAAAARAAVEETLA
jgi:hypothetical protein